MISCSVFIAFTFYISSPNLLAPAAARLCPECAHTRTWRPAHYHWDAHTHTRAHADFTIFVSHHWTARCTFMSLGAYLQAQKKAFLSLPASASAPRSVTLVSGNESGDADSLACALGVGYLLGQGTFPLLQTRARDLALRPENILALRTAGVAATDILTLDDVESTLKHLPDARIEIVLVDHNRLTANLAPFSPDVISVLDQCVRQSPAPTHWHPTSARCALPAADG